MGHERKFPAIVIFKEKHGDVVYLIMDKDEMYQCFAQVFMERHTAGYWYLDLDDDEAERLAKSRSGPWVYMRARDGGEYEGFEIIEPERVNE